MRPSFVQTTLEKSRVQGKPGASRTRSLMRKMEKAHERSHYRFSQIAQLSPRNGFTAYFVLSPVSEFLLVTVAAGLTPATWHQQRVSEPHDLAVRENVFVQHANAHLTLPRPPHPAPNVRDDREAPLLIEAGRGNQCS